MTHVYYNHVDGIIKANKLHRFESELNDCEDDERRIVLNQIINTIKSHKDQKQIKDEKIQAHFETLENSQYQKKWQYLSLDLKLNRLEEFMTRTNVTEENKIKLRKSITDNVLKTKDIQYNLNKGCIDEISETILNKPNTTSVKTAKAKATVKSK